VGHSAGVVAEGERRFGLSLHMAHTFTGELDGILALPLRTYSSGMSLRLSFAMATAYPRDILVIDEVIGAGDTTIRIGFVRSNGETIGKIEQEVQTRLRPVTRGAKCG
jgi:ABC-type nitrate/sulfonate/bicarbonate transport system ATPase subunit